ncbi:MAG: sulfite exporter TauE/SafE family protein [Clostridia bacterium]|nr:sulfite exporter TauE/SafE family protein [Clostridia bacterium]MBQ9481964.1 sulfite exporter TauE/SafE family protein [Clostridia bacterium]
MEKEAKDKILLSAAGILAGAANGLFGGGGGMIVVPMLVFLLGYPPRRAHATALAVILPVTVISGLIYALYGSFPLAEGIPAGMGVVAGGIVGALLLRKVKNGFLVNLFAFIMLIAGVRLLFF